MRYRVGKIYSVSMVIKQRLRTFGEDRWSNIGTTNA
jgi:hypothetical protein